MLDWRVVEVRELGQGAKESKTFPRVGSHRVTSDLSLLKLHIPGDPFPGLQAVSADFPPSPLSSWRRGGGGGEVKDYKRRS